MNSLNKNLLQEYFQKKDGKHGNNNLQLNYKSRQSDHGFWISILTLPDGRKFKGKGKRKKDAEQNAASAALLILIINPNEQKTKPNTKPNIIKYHFCGKNIILIDLENSPNYDKNKWLNIRWESTNIEAFVGKLSSHATKDLKTMYPFVSKFHIVDSGMKDAVDHAISVRAGIWLESSCESSYIADDCIYIVSRDRFSLALVDILKQYNPKSEIVHCVNIDKCFDILANKI